MHWGHLICSLDPPILPFLQCCIACSDVKFWMIFSTYLSKYLNIFQNIYQHILALFSNVSQLRQSLLHSVSLDARSYLNATHYIAMYWLHYIASIHCTALQQGCNNLAALQPESDSLKPTLVLLLSKGGQFLISLSEGNAESSLILTFMLSTINNMHVCSFDSTRNKTCELKYGDLQVVWGDQRKQKLSNFWWMLLQLG